MIFAKIFEFGNNNQVLVTINNNPITNSWEAIGVFYTELNGLVYNSYDVYGFSSFDKAQERFNQYDWNEAKDFMDAVLTEKNARLN